MPDVTQGRARSAPSRPPRMRSFCGYVFKTMSDPYTGTLSIIQLLSPAR
ncbi:MAG: hypothetical protein MZU79_09165 [Anaerotruncus sp.]|nr:hypothetical protein [Anaerotruncus sp.]